MTVILETLSQIQRVSSRLRYVNCGPGYIQCIYSFADLGFNIQLKIGPLLSVVSRQCNERYTASLVPITVHFLQFTLCELWSRTYRMYLQLRIFRRQYSSERIWAAIGDISAIQRAFDCIL
jgi:hypothetical protein